VHDNTMTTVLDQSFLPSGNNLANCVHNLPKVVILSLHMYLYKILGVDFLILLSRVWKCPSSVFLKPICPDLAGSVTHQSHQVT